MQMSPGERPVFIKAETAALSQHVTASFGTAKAAKAAISVATTVEQIEAALATLG